MSKSPLPPYAQKRVFNPFGLSGRVFWRFWNNYYPMTKFGYDMYGLTQNIMKTLGKI